MFSGLFCFQMTPVISSIFCWKPGGISDVTADRWMCDAARVLHRAAVCWVVWAFLALSWNILDPSHHFYHFCLQTGPLCLLWQTHPDTSSLCYLCSTNTYGNSISNLLQWNIQQQEPNISPTEGPSADESQACCEISLLSPVLPCNNIAELCLGLQVSVWPLLHSLNFPVAAVLTENHTKMTLLVSHYNIICRLGLYVV